MQLAKSIKDKTNDSIPILVPNFGNAGDAIIALGTFEFLKQQGIKYQFTANPERLRGSTVLFSGGGAFIGIYPRPEKLLQDAIRLAEHVIILPHSIKKVPSFLTENQNKLTVFARERVTHDYLAATIPQTKRHLDHDMAFYLDNSIKTIAKEKSFPLLLQCLFAGDLKQRLRPLKWILPAQKSLKQILSLAKEPQAQLNCFRSDAESAGKELPENNFDISNLFKFGTETKAAVRLGAKFFIKSIDAFETINTDRLHCGITAAILGKKVRFYPNNYYKNQAVFENSIKDKFPNVEWRGGS